MNIINVTSVRLWPLSTGGARHALTSTLELSKANNVSIITTQNSRGLEAYCPNVVIFPSLHNNSLLKFSPLTLFTLLKIIGKEKPDLIIFDFPWFGIYGWIIRFLTRIPFDIRAHNVEYIRFERLGKWWWPLLKLYEGFVYKNCHNIRYISSSDKIILQETYGLSENKFVYSPYIADSKVFYPNPKARKTIRQQLKLGKKKIILFFGPLDYQPNKEALDIITQKIAPSLIRHKDLLFLIAGKNPPSDITLPNVVFTGFVEKIEDYINASDLVIVPLISGGGVRTKIIESLACNKKIITTIMGCEGIEETSNLIVANIENFPKVILENIT